MSDFRHPEGGLEIRDIERFITEFESCALPKERWTHRAHLTVGLWYLSRHPHEEATEMIRTGIQRFNEAKGVKQTNDGGYHETITRFYIWVIADFLAGADRGRPLIELAEQLFAQCGDKGLPLRYWTKARLTSWEARTGWVAPDLKELESETA
ncbi:MAG: hypothetical protein P4L85_25100 [Paludisphaera borealis]|uniref:hypothetical protein n=1 Tax=Paludisphaera borealis TaxID=1387353 RepID=UPI002840E4BA|nr:hypothetical protein [Paludisphaera borealis]MDR3622654.1 hypothetical protein [Paludisphaera borealis]